MRIIPVEYPIPGKNISIRPIENVTDLIIHHSDGPISQTPLDIDTEERNAPPPNGPYAMVPYEWLISWSGIIFAGRPLQYESGASFGRNPVSVSICLIGDFQEGTPGYDAPTASQIQSLKELALYVHQTIPTIERTIAHGDIAEMFYPDNKGPYATDCCGSKLREYLDEVRAYVAENLKGD